MAKSHKFLRNNYNLKFKSTPKFNFFIYFADSWGYIAHQKFFGHPSVDFVIFIYLSLKNHKKSKSYTEITFLPAVNKSNLKKLPKVGTGDKKFQTLFWTSIWYSYLITHLWGGLD